MDQLMFRYRAGAYFANIYAPDITLGMMTSEEASDIIDEPRVAVGRVVDPTSRIENPYAVPDETAFSTLKGAIEDMPPLDPQPTGEPPLESPVEVSEGSERDELLFTIQDWLSANDFKMATFSPKCREAGLLPAGVQVRDKALPIANLRAICENRLAILEGTYRKGGEA
jgi:hypothetical protein